MLGNSSETTQFERRTNLQRGHKPSNERFRIPMVCFDNLLNSENTFVYCMRGMGIEHMHRTILNISRYKLRLLGIARRGNITRISGDFEEISAGFEYWSNDPDFISFFEAAQNAKRD